MLLLQRPMLLKLDRFWLSQYSEQELRQSLGLTMGPRALRPLVWPVRVPSAEPRPQPFALTLLPPAAASPALWPPHRGHSDPRPALEEEATLSRTAYTRPLQGQSQAAKATNDPAIGSCVCAKGC